MAKPIRVFCEHGLSASVCKLCRKAYDAQRSVEKQERYYKIIESIGCEACTFSHRYALELHHFATEYKRYGRSQGHKPNLEDWLENKAVYLCGNCHNIFHGIYGGKTKPFPLLTKQQTIDVIMKERNSKLQSNTE